MRRISALVCDLDFWNSVNNQICAPPVRDPLGFSHKILLCVEDDVVSAAVALVAHTLIPTMPWAEVIALGAVVAPTFLLAVVGIW
jgi:hypothetical protein